MDIDYVLAVMMGRHLDVGAPAPMLSDAARARAARRLLDMSPLGDPAPMLCALGMIVERTTLPRGAPIAVTGSRILIAEAAAAPLRNLLELAGLALMSLRFETAAHSLSDVWLVVASIGAT